MLAGVEPGEEDLTFVCCGVEFEVAVYIGIDDEAGWL